MANGIRFGTYHSSTDLELFLNSKVIGAPNVRMDIIKVPGANKSVDMSECFGEVKYDDRELKFKFTKIGGEFISVFSEIQNKLHGQRVNITIDTDPDYYYNGRLSVDEWNATAATGEITVSAMCDPYKYKNALTTQEEVITTSKTVVITNDRKKAFPKITTTAAFSIVMDGVTYSYGIVAAMQTTIPLLKGNNTLEITGTGTITFEWQEGAL